MKRELLRELSAAFVLASLRCETEHGINPGEFVRFLRNPTGSHSTSRAELDECLAPVIDAAFAKHLADNAVVTRDDLELVAEVTERLGCEKLRVSVHDDGSGLVSSSNMHVHVGFGEEHDHKTVSAALQSLLEKARIAAAPQSHVVFTLDNTRFTVTSEPVKE